MAGAMRWAFWALLGWVALAGAAAGAAAAAASRSEAAPAADPAPPPAVVPGQFSAAQIVEKNVAARGGLEAWRNVRTMVWQGHITNPGSPQSEMSFVLQQKRANKTRFDVRAMNQRSVRVFDGTGGWKIASSPDGKPKVEPYTQRELQFARDSQGIDGPLIDYQAKGNTVALEGVDEVDGRKAYRLAVTQPSGDRHHVWVDAQTFLDVKSDRTSYDPAGSPRTIVVSFRDFRTVEGLQIPGLIETGTGAGAQPARMTLEKIVLNPPLGDRVFAKPNVSGHRGAITVDTRSAAGDGQPLAGSTSAPRQSPASTPR